MSEDHSTSDATAEGTDGQTERTLPAHPLLHGLAEAHPDVTFETVLSGVGPPQDVATVSRDGLVDFLADAHDRGYSQFVDLCGVDYLRRRPRYEVVINVLCHEPPHRLRVRVGVPHDDPNVPSVTSVFPGANFYERETYDLFGIVFTGHPDLTRILLPDDWEGHPLRKDHSVGSVPVHFKHAHKAS